MSLVKISDVEFITIEVTKEYISGLTKHGTIIVFNREDKKILYELNIQDMINGPIQSVYQYSQSLSYIYFDCGQGLIIDLANGMLYDKLVGRSVALTQDDRFFYTNYGNVMEYKIHDKTHIPIDIGVNGIYIEAFNESLLVYHGLDGPGSYSVYNMDDRWLDQIEVDLSSYNYIVIYDPCDFASAIRIYDLDKEQMQTISTSWNYYDYQIVGDKIMYQEISARSDDELFEPQTLQLREGSTIYDYSTEHN